MTDLTKIIKELKFRSGELYKLAETRDRKDFQYALTKATANQALEDAQWLERFVQELEKEAKDADSCVKPTSDYRRENTTYARALRRVIGEGDKGN